MKLDKTTGAVLARTASMTTLDQSWSSPSAGANGNAPKQLVPDRAGNVWVQYTISDFTTRVKPTGEAATFALTLPTTFPADITYQMLLPDPAGNVFVGTPGTAAGVAKFTP